MRKQERPDGSWGIYTDEATSGRHCLVAILPTERTADVVLGEWETDWVNAQARYQAVLVRLGSELHGSGLEPGLRKELVLQLGGRWMW